MRLFTGLILAGSLSYLVNCGTLSAQAAEHISASQLEKESVALTGPWEFYKDQLISPGDPSMGSGFSLVELPRLWREDGDSVSIGVATYKLRVTIDHTLIGKQLALRMPDVYSASQIWIDKKLFKSNGTVGLTKETTKPVWHTTALTFQPTSDTISFVLQIANFHHSKGGITKPIYIGLQEHVVKKLEQARNSNTILFIALLLIAAIVSAIYFVVQEKNPAMLFYIGLCIAWASRVIFSNLYLAVEWLPEFDWIWVVRIEYITLYLTMVFGMLFVAYLFPEDVNKSFKIMYLMFGAIFTVFTLVTPPLVFTQFVQIYLSFSALLLLAILAIIIKALINSRKGATLFLLNIIYGVAMFGYVILAYQRVFELDEIIFSIGFLILFISTGIAMGVRLMRSARAHDSDMLTFDQLYGKN